MEENFQVFKNLTKKNENWFVEDLFVCFHFSNREFGDESQLQPIAEQETKENDRFVVPTPLFLKLMMVFRSRAGKQKVVPLQSKEAIVNVKFRADV